MISGENNVESPDGVTEVITGFVPFHTVAVISSENTDIESPDGVIEVLLGK